MDPIWATTGETGGGYGRTAKDALAEFARGYWAQPRKAKLSRDGRTFTMVGGTGRVYAIDLVKGAHGPAFVVTIEADNLVPLAPKGGADAR